MLNALSGKGIGYPCLSRVRGLGSIIPLPTSSGAEPQPKMILVYFVPEKLPLLNRILLNVAKSCVMKLLK